MRKNIIIIIITIFLAGFIFVNHRQEKLIHKYNSLLHKMGNFNNMLGDATEERSSHFVEKYHELLTHYDSLLSNYESLLDNHKKFLKQYDSLSSYHHHQSRDYSALMEKKLELDIQMQALRGRNQRIEDSITAYKAAIKFMEDELARQEVD